jgi:hypothetical protein
MSHRSPSIEGEGDRDSDSCFEESEVMPRQFDATLDGMLICVTRAPTRHGGVTLK